MNSKIKNIIMTVVFSVFLLFVSIICLATPPKQYSESERRELAKFPVATTETVINGDFSTDFESYTVDQFPSRDAMRSIKTFIATKILGKADNNGLFYADGHISKIDTVENEEMMLHAKERFEFIKNTYLKENDVYFSIIPDKNYYLARPNGYPSLDYEGFIKRMSSLVDFKYIDVTDLLSLDDYYTTDTHWRQENISDVADRLASSMGTDLTHDYVVNSIDKPFYGVYSGQYAGSVKPDTLKYLTSDIINNTIVTYNDGMSPKAKQGDMYNMEMAVGRDPYEMFLSGTMPLVTLENPNATEEKELILFRDSFGSSIAPLFLSGYSKVTVIDIRYIKSEYLGALVDFNEDADVLFMYSTTLLNNSLALK